MLNEYQRMWIKDRNWIIRGNDIEYLKTNKEMFAYRGKNLFNEIRGCIFRYDFPRN